MEPLWIFREYYLDKIHPKSSLINSHRLVIISCPEHMQITPDTEGYLSMSYSTVNRQKQHGCWWTWPSVMKWTRHQLLKQHTQWMEPWFTAKECRDLTAGRPGEGVNCSYISSLFPPLYANRRKKRSTWGQRTEGLKCLRLKCTQNDSLRTCSRCSSKMGFFFSLHTELDLYIFIIHKTNTWARQKMHYNSWHLQVTVLTCEQQSLVMTESRVCPTHQQ